MTGEETGWIASLAGIFGDKYGVHVLACYAVTLGGLAVLGWAIFAANTRARRELEELDRERMR